MRAGAFFSCFVVLLAPLAVPPRPVDPGRARTRPVAKPIPTARVLDGITFAIEPSKLYVPVQELRDMLNLPLRWESGEGRAYFGNKRVSRRYIRRLLDGTPLVSLRLLQDNQIAVNWQRRWFMASISYRGKQCWVRDGVKRIAVNRSRQWLRGWQGRRLVMETNVSTGRPGFTTPAGQFTAGPFKAPMHYSRLYNDAPMPWTVQVEGNVCIHGSNSVPRYPASHGCVRVPLTGANPARFIYEWVNRGAAVEITDQWPWAGTTEPADRQASSN